MSCVMPDGRVHEGHVVWGDLSKGSVLSKGYAVQFPDLSASDDQAFMDLESDIRLMLGSLKADERLQLQFYTSSDFSGPLNRFVENTRARSKCRNMQHGSRRAGVSVPRPNGLRNVDPSQREALSVLANSKIDERGRAQGARV